MAKRELSLPEQRRLIRQKEEQERNTRALAIKRSTTAKRDLALRKWAKVEVT